MPEALGLTVSQQERRLEVEWPRRLGELRRKATVGGLAVGLVLTGRAIYLLWASGRWRSLPLLLLLLTDCAVGLMLLRQLLVQARGTGHARLTFVPDRLRCEPGGGGWVQDFSRGNTAFNPALGGIQVCFHKQIGLLGWLIRLLRGDGPIIREAFLRPLDTPERDWILETLARWRDGTLFER